MNNISPEQLAAKEKAIAVIESCVMCEHLATAIPYIELFLKQFQDIEAYNELMSLFKNKKLSLNCND